MSTGAEVRIRLGVDDAMAHAAIAKASAGFGELHKQAMQAASSVRSAVGGFAKNMLMAAGLGVASGGLSSVIGAAVDATKAAESQKRAIASALALTDQTGASYEQLKAKAGAMRGEFVEMGMKAGVMASTVTEIFTELAERSGKSTTEVKLLTEQILAAGRVTGDTEMLTRGMSMLEKGMVGARNPIVAMIRSTGVLKGSIHEVAVAMGKLKPEQQMAAGEEAIRRLAAKAKGMEPTFGMLANQMKQMKQNVLEDIGGPLMKGIIPSLMEVQKWIQSNRKEIEHYAQLIGSKVGEWVKTAAKLMGEAFKYLETHATEIKDAISVAASALKSAIGFILDHKGEIAAALVIKSVATTAGASGGTGALVGGGLALGYELGMAGAKALGLGRFADSAQKADALIQAINSETVKAEAAALRGDTVAVAASEKITNAISFQIAALKEWTVANHDDLVRTQTLLRDTAQRKADQAQLSAVMKREHILAGLPIDMANAMGVVRMGPTKEDLARHKIEATGPYSKDARAGYAEQDRAIAEEAKTQMDAIGKEIATVYNNVGSLQEKESHENAITLLRASADARRALTESGAEIVGGIEGLVAAVGGKAGQDLMDRWKLAHPSLQQTFNGGQTFHIAQDFRKADPDDVALITRKDIFTRSMARGFSKAAILGGA